MIKNIRRWIVLAAAAALACASLLTAFKAPLRMDWRLRMHFGILVGEFGLWLSLLPLGAAVTAWLLRRGHLKVASATLALCAVAFLLFLKPTAQAFLLGWRLPAQLG